MRAVAIILANSEFVSAFFLKLKNKKAEMTILVICFVNVLLLYEKNLKIAIGNPLKKLMLRISKQQNSKSVKKYDL